jgi:PhnB protein
MPEPLMTIEQIADALRDLPRPSFRKRLKTALAREARATERGATRNASERTAPMTTVIESQRPVAGRQTAAPRLRVKNAAAAIDFYTRAFGARELMRFEGHGRIAHAELEIGNAIIMLGEEAPEYGFPGPETLGGSPVSMRLDVDDADRWVDRAVAAGARLVTPPTDQFYGHRVGHVADPFGFGWDVVQVKEELSVPEMHQRMAALEAQQSAGRTSPTFIREGFRTVTPYVVVADAAALLDFVRTTFDAAETLRTTGPGGGVHAEVRIGDSMLMVGGGHPDRPIRIQPIVTAFHLYVPDVDATYARALQAGAESIGEPRDQEYGERGAGVKDRSGNVWYIATAKGERYVPQGWQTLNVYLHPLRAEPVIAFMTRAFGATGVEKYASPDGVIRHAHLRIGDSVIEMGEAHGPYQPMPTRFYLYVPNADASYRRALEAGATSIHEPRDQPFGDRMGGVKDAFGNEWYLATRNS